MRVTGARQCLRLYRIYGGQYGPGPASVWPWPMPPTGPSPQPIPEFSCRTVRAACQAFDEACLFRSVREHGPLMIEPPAMDPAIALLAFVTLQRFVEFI